MNQNKQFTPVVAVIGKGNIILSRLYVFKSYDSYVDNQHDI